MEKYFLNGDILPTIPVPQDSIKNIKPDANISIIMPLIKH